jgi:hypothetical protein
LSSSSEYGNKQILDDSLRGFVWVIAGLAICSGVVGMWKRTMMSILERNTRDWCIESCWVVQQKDYVHDIGESVVVFIFSAGYWAQLEDGF